MSTAAPYTELELEVANCILNFLNFDTSLNEVQRDAEQIAALMSTLLKGGSAPSGVKDFGKETA